jgi:crotonobetainyl-CoA:carnitine CoA-transferase CaiB-like acyl-CoA transferase
MGILAALLSRAKTGKGQMVDVSMQDVMYFQNFRAWSDKATAPVKDQIVGIFGRDMSELLTDYEHPMPFWNSYKAKDGYVVVVALTDQHWNDLLDAVGREELIEDERFSNFVARIKNADEGLKIIKPWMTDHTCGEIIDTLNERRIPCGKVQDFDELNQDPQLAQRDMFRNVTHDRLGEIDVPGCPIRLTDTPPGFSKPCPDFGQHTNEILSQWLGKTEGEIQALREDGSVM